MFVADLHNDLVQRVIEGEDVTKLTSHGHTDIPRLLKSEIDLEILIIWVSSNSKEPNFFKRADKMYDEIERISSHEEIVIPKKLSDINEAINNNKLAYQIFRKATQRKGWGPMPVNALLSKRQKSGNLLPPR